MKHGLLLICFNTDMAVGPFWITGERLKMTAFTVPLGVFCLFAS